MGKQCKRGNVGWVEIFANPGDLVFYLIIRREKTLPTLQKIDTVGTTLHLQNLFKRDHLVAIRKNSFPPKIITFLKFTFRYPIFVFCVGVLTVHEIMCTVSFIH